jgi:hypothetical protein
LQTVIFNCHLVWVSGEVEIVVCALCGRLRRGVVHELVVHASCISMMSCSIFRQITLDESVPLIPLYTMIFLGGHTAPGGMVTDLTAY